MSRVTEINVLENWTLSVNHFYELLKSSLGEISPNGKYQLQMSAIPLDVDPNNYEWFSRGNINSAFDVALEPVPVSERLTGGLQVGSKLSEEYGSFLETAVSLVEQTELPEDVIKKIARLNTDIENLDEKEFKLMKNLFDKWKIYSELRMIDFGDRTAYLHWRAGQSESGNLIDIRQQKHLKLASVIALRNRNEYENENHKKILEAYSKFISSSATMRYPRVEDSSYGEEQEKFSMQYFANLDAHNSIQFSNKYAMFPEIGLDTIANSTFGGFSSKYTKTSEATEDITTDWSFSGSVGYGPFKAKLSASSKEVIEEEFKAVTEITVGAKSLIAIPYLADTWFTPTIFKNPLVKSNRRLFQRWLGENGTLRVYPTHLVVCRGFNLRFKNEQEWQYDYEKDFTSSAGGSASAFGIKFGARGQYHRHVERQKIEKRGHDLIFDDGEENIRILGYHTALNEPLSDWTELETLYIKAQKSQRHFQKKNSL